MSKRLEKQHRERIVGLGCIACHNMGIEDSPACIHHIRNGYGMAQRAPEWEILPLCHQHHQGGHGVGFHGGSSTWEKKYGTERELLRQCREMLIEQYGEVLIDGELCDHLPVSGQ